MMRLILIGGALLSVLMVYLLLEIHLGAEARVDPDRLAEARAASEARRAARERPVEIPEPEPAVEPEPEPEPEPKPEPEPEPEPVSITLPGKVGPIDDEPPAFDGESLQERMYFARRLYRWGKFEQAYTLATRLLEKDPENRILLRVAVASSCVMFYPEDAAYYYEALPRAKDRRTFRRHCRRFGVELEP